MFDQTHHDNLLLFTKCLITVKLYESNRYHHNIYYRNIEILKLHVVKFSNYSRATSYADRGHDLFSAHVAFSSLICVGAYF